nr:DUF4184 family protein [Pontibacter sp. SGAir0037]
MPFTFAHPAAILPFKVFPARWRSMTGLVIGSIAPDFEKFLWLRSFPFDAYSHTWQSIFYFNLPLGLLLAFLFHRVVRDVLVENLPAFLRVRLRGLGPGSWHTYFRQRYAIVVGSVLVGSATHIAWDAFTHLDGRGTKLFPVLLKKVTIGGHGWELFNLLQLGSSVAGLLLVFLALVRLPKAEGRKGVKNGSILYWSMFTFVAALAASLRVCSGYPLQTLSNLAILLIAAGLFSLLVTSFLFSRRKTTPVV